MGHSREEQMDKRTPLHGEHLALGARMTSFAGWEMPLSYPAGPIEEHRRVREAAGLFDLSHMGRIVVSGGDSVAFLQALVTANVQRLQDGDATYAPMCYADGGVVDDTFIYRTGQGWLVVVNAANAEKDMAWLQYQSPGMAVQIVDHSAESAMLAIQGPRSQHILQQSTPLPLDTLRRNQILRTRVAGVEALVARTGYTGEDGFELYLRAADALQVWRTLLEVGQPDGLLPVGLAARDSLRFEACFPLYGHELRPDITPLQAGLGWAVALKKAHFIGRDALLKERLEGVPRTLVGFEMLDRGVPRHGMTVFIQGEPLGWVTSGLYAPTLDRFLGLAFVPPDKSALGTEISIELRGQPRRAQIIKRPFYTPAYQKTRTGASHG